MSWHSDSTTAGCRKVVPGTRGNRLRSRASRSVPCHAAGWVSSSTAQCYSTNDIQLNKAKKEKVRENRSNQERQFGSHTHLGTVLEHHAHLPAGYDAPAVTLG